MGKETLQTLAEIKMHIPDEHITQGLMKSRLKRRFGTVDMPTAQDLAEPPESSLPSIVQADTAQVSPAPSTSSTGGNPPDNPSTQTAETKDSILDSGSVRTLGEIVDQFFQQGELDGGELGTDISTVLPPQTTINAPVSLEDLFDSN